MNAKDRKLRESICETLRPDEKKREQVSGLLDRMISKELTTQERVERFKSLLTQCRDESQEIQRIRTEEGNPSGLNLLSITEHLEESLRFAEFVEVSK